MTISKAGRWYRTRGLATALGVVGVSTAAAGTAAAAPASTPQPAPHTMVLTSTASTSSTKATAYAVAPTWQVGIGTQAPRARTGAAR